MKTLKDYAKRPLDSLVFGHLTHQEMARKARMLMRYDFDHEAVVVGARDRIMWLAAQLEAMEQLMIRWRIVAQSMTPGGSEYMDPNLVAWHIRCFKHNYHEAKTENVRLKRRVKELEQKCAT